MTKFYASVLAIGATVAVAGCGGLPGMECKFAKGEVVASAEGDAKAFLSSALELKNAVDELEGAWNAEIKAMAGELKIESADEGAVLAKLNANIKELKAQGECEVTFDANLDVSASGSASGSGSAATGEGASGAGKGAGSASAHVDVKFDLKCKAEAKVKASLDVTTATIKGHFPKLLGIVVQYKGLAGKVKAVGEAGTKVMGVVKTQPLLIGEVKCAVEAVAGIKVQARVDFSVKASASAKGEAAAG